MTDGCLTPAVSHQAKGFPPLAHLRPRPRPPRTPSERVCVLCCFRPDVPASDADAKDSQTGGGEDGEQDEDLDEEPIFTCDNCQQDFDCLAELTEHRTHHCPAGKTLTM